MNRQSLLWAGGIAIGLLALLGGLLFINAGRQGRIVSSLNDQQQTSVMAPTAAPPPPSPAPNALPTATPAPAATAPPAVTPIAAPTAAPEILPSPTPSVVIQPVAPQAPIFFDDFALATSGWAPFDVDRRGNFNGYRTGQYVFDLADPDSLRYDALPNNDFASGQYALDFRYEGGSGAFGLMLGIQGDIQAFNSLSFYRLDLVPPGSVTLTRYLSGRPAGDQPSNESISKAQIDLNQLNHLEVRDTAEGMQVFVNNTLVLRAPNIHAPEGRIGLFAHSGDQPLRVAFDNLLVVADSQPDAPVCEKIRTLQLQPAGQYTAGADVQIVQRRLLRLGYASGAIDSIYGPLGAGAIQNFQERNQLLIDGIIGPQTWCRLLSSDAVGQDGRTEARAELERYAAVPLTTAFPSSTALFISIRQPDASWRIGIILPGHTMAHYLETDGDAFDPAFSPDGRFLAFTSERGGMGAIWVLDTRTGEVRQISMPDKVCSFPAWSPDARFISYTAEPVGRPGLAARTYIFDTTTQQTRLFADEHTGWTRWSANNEILFTRWSGKSFDIFRANPDGSGVVNLTNTDTFDEDIANWSADGTQIAFAGSPSGDLPNRQIFIMNRDGSGMRQVTTIPGPNSNPVWSSDRQTIAFVNEQPGATWHIWLVDTTGGAPYQLSTNQERVWFLNWLLLR